MVQALENEVFLRVRLVPVPGHDQGQQAARPELEREDRGLSDGSGASPERAAADDPGPGVPLAEAGEVTTLVEEMDHTAARPSWDCRACGRHWPCDPAREHLASELDRVHLSVYMWSNLEEAARDMPAGPPSELFERFIRWTH